MVATTKVWVNTQFIDCNVDENIWTHVDQRAHLLNLLPCVRVLKTCMQEILRHHRVWKSVGAPPATAYTMLIDRKSPTPYWALVTDSSWYPFLTWNWVGTEEIPKNEKTVKWRTPSTHQHSPQCVHMYHNQPPSSNPTCCHATRNVAAWQHWTDSNWCTLKTCIKNEDVNTTLIFGNMVNPTKHTTDLRNVLSNHFEEKKPIVTFFKNWFTTVKVELESAIQNPDNRH